MPGPDLLEPVHEPATVPAAGRRRWHRTRAGALALPVAMLVLGAVALWVGLDLLSGASALPRIAVAGGAVVALFAGLDRLLRLVVGPGTQTGLWLSVAWVAVVVVAAAFADLLPLAESRNTALAVDEPALLRPDLLSAHPLGTDRQGLDILGGVIYGARVSLTVGAGAVAIGLVVGGLLGLLAGFYRGRLEAAVSFLTDTLIAFPPLILLLALVAVLEPSVRNVTLGLAVLGIPTYIRIARANTLVVAQKEFVLAARVLGARNRRLLFREVLPNVVSSLVSYAFVVIAVLIVAEASLSYLGLSVQRPNPTWGNMIAAGQNSVDRHPHLVFVPGLVLFLTVFALTRIGEAARRLWDPRAGGR